MTAAPRVFYGESLPGGGEVLTAGPALSWGSYHDVKIISNRFGGFNFLLDGNLLADSYYSHFSYAQAGFVGELNGKCQNMVARAKEASGGVALQGRNQGSLHAFNDNRMKQYGAGADTSVPLANVRIGGQSATSLAFGGESFR